MGLNITEYTLYSAEERIDPVPLSLRETLIYGCYWDSVVGNL